MLTQERLKEKLHYCQESGIFTKICKKTGELTVPVKGKNTLGYIAVGIDYHRYYAHRLVWLYMFGTMPKRTIDHINGNPSDNRLCNLRECSHADNQKNQKKPKNNTSGYKGVTFCRVTNKWKSQLKHNGKNHNIGLFETPKEAHAAYMEKAEDIFKEYSSTGER